MLERKEKVERRPQEESFELDNLALAEVPCLYFLLSIVSCSIFSASPKKSG
jgi:hypothetical protein